MILTHLKKANKKYHALARMWNYIHKKKWRILRNAFITSQFSYCPLFWKLHSRTMNNRINKIHKKALRLAYWDETNPSLDDLLKNNKSVRIEIYNQRNLQILATEIYEVRNDLGPEISTLYRNRTIWEVIQSAKAKKPHSVLWNRKQIFSCSQNMGNTQPTILKVNNRNTKTRSEICSKLRIKTPEWRHCQFLPRLKTRSHQIFPKKKQSSVHQINVQILSSYRYIENVGFV